MRVSELFIVIGYETFQGSWMILKYLLKNVTSKVLSTELLQHMGLIFLLGELLKNVFDGCDKLGIFT